MSPNFSSQQLFEACRVLFPAARIHQEFIMQLRIQSVKKSFRELAKRHHPDSYNDQSSGVPADAVLFRKANQAYQLLCNFIKERDLVVVTPTGRRVADPPPENRASQPTHTTHTTFTTQPKAQPADRTARRRPHQRWTRAARNPDDVYYEGPMPTFRLKLGLYLYYRGVIPYSALVKALIWQRDMRPPIGDLAVAWGWLEPHFVSTIRSATELTGSFGEKAVELGLLTRSQVGVLLLHQRMMQAQVGRYFVTKGFLTERELAEHMHEHTQFNLERGGTREVEF
jgi:hypothetical protein